MKKIISLLLSIIMLMGVVFTLVSCVNPNDGTVEEVDTKKTQLYVLNFDGGFGNEWIYEVKARFEAKYANYQGVDGKVGVQIIIEDGKDDVGSTFVNNIAYDRNEIFFTEGVLYYDLVSQGLLTEITDVMTETLTEYGEDTSIFDKLSKEQQDFYRTSDGKIYAVPFRSNFEGFVYDIDLFNDHSLYFAKGGAPSEYCEFIQTNNDNPASGTFSDYEYTNLDGERSAGPDGLYGTRDDGLPATYDEFFVLCDYMKSTYGITPFEWAGVPEIRGDYLAKQTQQLIADFEGLANFTSYYTYSGTLDHIVDSIDANGKATYKAPVSVTEDTAYLVTHSAGRYYAASFMERVIEGKYYSSKSFNATNNHIGAQENFLRSKYEGQGTAFLVDGIWWENESKVSGVFKDMEGIEGAGINERNFSLLQLPKATVDQIGEPATYADNLLSLALINGNIAEEKKELAKAFLQFCFTEESNIKYHITTGCPRSMTYTMSEEDLAQLSPYGRNLYDIAQNCNIVYTYGNNDTYKLLSGKRGYRYGGAMVCDAANIFDAFKDEPSKYNAAGIFNASKCNSLEEFLNNMQ